MTDVQDTCIFQWGDLVDLFSVCNQAIVKARPLSNLPTLHQHIIPHFCKPSVPWWRLAYHNKLSGTGEIRVLQ